MDVGLSLLTVTRHFTLRDNKLGTCVDQVIEVFAVSFLQVGLVATCGRSPKSWTWRRERG